MLNRPISRLISLRIALLLFIFACSIFAIIILHSVVRVEQQASNLSRQINRSIIIDAGHGGQDGGAVGKSEWLEKDINLSIAMKLKEFLEVSGFEVIMTRETDDFIDDDPSATVAERKKTDMHARLKIINEHPNSLFVSIHQNHFDNSTLFGAQVFYSVNHQNSVLLADSIQNSVISLIQNNNERQSKAAENTIFLLKNAQIPAVIVECGFLSNASEAKLLCDDTYQNKMAFSIFCGIINYYAVA